MNSEDIFSNTEDLVDNHLMLTNLFGWIRFSWSMQRLDNEPMKLDNELKKPHLQNLSHLTRKKEISYKF